MMVMSINVPNYKPLSLFPMHFTPRGGTKSRQLVSDAKSQPDPANWCEGHAMRTRPVRAGMERAVPVKAGTLSSQQELLASGLQSSQ